MKIKYESHSGVRVERGDIVVDCGAFVGGFSEYASRKARQVHAIEPSVRNYRCIAKNTDKVEIHKIAFDRYTGNKDLNLSETNVDDSLIDTDSNPIGRTETVRCMNIDNWMEKNGIESIDFLKLEAEGNEVDIIDGTKTNPKKISIDCSPEVKHKSNKKEIKTVLSSRGYKISESKYMVYGRLE